MKWAVFDIGAEVHTAPCTEEGALLATHTLDGSCECRPRQLLSELYPMCRRARVWLHHDGN